MKKIILLLMVVIFISSCSKPRVDEDRGYLPSELSVKFKANVAQDQSLIIIKQYNLKIIKESADNTFRIQLPRGKNSTEMKSMLESLPQVQSVAAIREIQVVLK